MNDVFSFGHCYEISIDASSAFSPGTKHILMIIIYIVTNQYY